MADTKTIFITTPRGGLNVHQIAEYEISEDGRVKITTRTPTSASYYHLEGEMAVKAIEVLKSWSS